VIRQTGPKHTSWPTQDSEPKNLKNFEIINEKKTKEKEERGFLSGRTAVIHFQQ
jgi:hypothetical protein